MSNMTTVSATVFGLLIILATFICPDVSINQVRIWIGSYLAGAWLAELIMFLVRKFK